MILYLYVIFSYANTSLFFASCNSPVLWSLVLPNMGIFWRHPVQKEPRPLNLSLASISICKCSCILKFYKYMQTKMVSLWCCYQHNSYVNLWLIFILIRCITIFFLLRSKIFHDPSPRLKWNDTSSHLYFAKVAKWWLSFEFNVAMKSVRLQICWKKHTKQNLNYLNYISNMVRLHDIFHA